MNAWTSIEAFFSNLWTNDLKPDVQEAEQVAVAFFSAAANAAATQLGVAGLKIVTDAVTAAENAGGTGAAKLAAASTAITSDLATAGITAAQNVINAGIEGAVAQLKTATIVPTEAAPASPETTASPPANG
jgi:hypothetical protein